MIPDMWSTDSREIEPQFIQVNRNVWIKDTTITCIEIMRGRTKRLRLWVYEDVLASDYIEVETEYLKGVCELLGLPYDKICKTIDET